MTNIPSTPIALWYFNAAQRLEETPTHSTRWDIIKQLFNAQDLAGPVTNYYWDICIMDPTLPTVVCMEMSVTILWLYMISTVAAEEGV